MIITWPIAITLIGGIASVCLTVLRIYSMRKSTNGNGLKKQLDKTREELAKAKQDLAVLEAKSADEKENLDKLEDKVDKLTDLLYELLTKLASDHHD